MEGDTIKGVITESKAGRQAIDAKRVIDATGDADVVYNAGAPYRKDPKIELQAVSVKTGKTCRRVYISMIQKALTKQGVRMT